MKPDQESGPTKMSRRSLREAVMGLHDHRQPLTGDRREAIRVSTGSEQPGSAVATLADVDNLRLRRRRTLSVACAPPSR
jgi:hypothetical protein